MSVHSDVLKISASIVQGGRGVSQLRAAQERRAPTHRPTDPCVSR